MRQRDERANLQTLAIPAFASFSKHRIFEDALDSDRIYVDVLEPEVRSRPVALDHLEPMLGRAESRAARPVCVAFGPDDDAIRSVRALYPDRQVVPLSWNAGPFHAWSRSGAGVSVIGQGTTQRSERHQAVIRGTQPGGVELAQAVAAAELVHWGSLTGMTIKATAKAGVIAELRETVRLGRRAVWSSSLYDVLRPALSDLLRRDRLEIVVASGAVPIRAFEEVRDLVLIEWARRVAGNQSLARPAGQVEELMPVGSADLRIDWRDGDQVPLRVVRSLRYESIAVDSLQSLSWGLAGQAREQIRELGSLSVQGAAMGDTSSKALPQLRVMRS